MRTLEASPARGSSRTEPVAIPGADTGFDTSAQLDMISRSLPTAGPVLEPATTEYALLKPDKGRVVDDADSLADETAPLLRRQRGGSFAAGPASEASAPVLFYYDTSVQRFWLIFAQVLLAHFISCFDGTIMASSHPVITSHFHAANSASWLSTSFLLTSTASQPLLGRLSDSLGRKPLFVGSVAVFALATVGCALAPSIGSFIVARAICGIGAGGTMTIGSIITSDLVPIERRGTYQAYINITYGIGSSLGAALGGAMAEALGWRWEFGIQIPPLLLCLVVSQFAIPDELGIEDSSVKKSIWTAFAEFDVKGSILLIVSITFFILGLSLGGNVLPWSHPFVITSLCVFAVSFSTFFWVESKAAKPILPLYLIWHAPRANLIFSSAIASILSNAIVFNIPLYFQAVLLSSATDSGLRLVIATLTSSIMGAITGFAITWTRRLKWPVMTGTVLYLIGCISLACLQRGLPPILYLLALVPYSLGQGLHFPGSTMSTLATSSQSEQAVVIGALFLWRNLGTVLGIAASSLIVQNALVYYLNIFVEGDMKDEIITKVRKSVEAIIDLDPHYRDQVVLSYEAALRMTFMCCIVAAVVSLLIVLPMKMPRLPARRS